MASTTDAALQEVKERHAKVLSLVGFSDGVGETKSTLGKTKIQDHPRWKELIKDNNVSDRTELGKVEASTREDNNTTSSVSSSLLGPAYIPAETTVRNDYSQHFIDTGAGRLPGNAVCNPDKSSRFEEYPKLKGLIQTKSDILSYISHAPVYLQTDLLESTTTSPLSFNSTAFHLTRLLPIKFDVVIIDPPLETYEWESVPGKGSECDQVWSWDQVAALPIPQIMAKESFIFLWVGSGANDGLERGREALMKWGYRRCEDIVWVQTNPHNGSDNVVGKNISNSGHFVQASSSSCFAKSAQHCLMGIRGTVRRSTDTRFVHCNIDTDVILWNGEKSSSDSSTIDVRSKPPEMMDLIENFCLGTRRLELFGRNRNLRRGWLTVGNDIGPQGLGWEDAEKGLNACAADANRKIPIAYDKSVYDSFFGVDRAGCALAERINLVPFHEEVELLRPRSPSSGNDRRTMQASKSPNQQQQQHRLYQQHFQQNTDAVDNQLFLLMQSSASLGNPVTSTGGAGISGLGAGGPSVVSVPSGSEMLSGAQANVLFGQASTLGSARFNQPLGLGRNRKSPAYD